MSNKLQTTNYSANFHLMEAIPMCLGTITIG